MGSEILYFCIPRDADLIDSGIITDPGIHRYTGPISLGITLNTQKTFWLKGLECIEEEEHCPAGDTVGTDC